MGGLPWKSISRLPRARNNFLNLLRFATNFAKQLEPTAKRGERGAAQTMDSGRRPRAVAPGWAGPDHGGRPVFASPRALGERSARAWPNAAHPYEYGAGSGARQHSPPAFRSDGSPNYVSVARESPKGHAVPVNVVSPQRPAPINPAAPASPRHGSSGSMTPSSPGKSPGLDEHARAKVAHVQNVASAVEGGLRKQRDHLQAQLDNAARREAELESRISELEEKLLLEDSVWSELALDPRMAPEAMALQLRRAKEMQMWAQRAEEDERRARVTAEAALKQLAQERDAAQQQLALAQAKLAEVRDPKSALSEVQQRRLQHGGGGAETGNDVSPLVSRDALPAAGREHGRQHLEAVMQEAYRRAGVAASAHGGNGPRQRSLEPSPGYAPRAADASPYTPRVMETSNSLAPSAQKQQPQSRSSPSFEIDEVGRLLVAPSVSPRATAPESKQLASSSSDEDSPVGEFAGVGAGSGGRQGGSKSSPKAAVHARGGAGPPRMARAGPVAAAAKTGAVPSRHPEALGRLSVMSGEPGHQGPGSGGRASAPQQAWWRGGVGAHGDDDAPDASEYDDHVTAAGTISYSNDPENSDDTALSVSDEAAGSSDDDLMRNHDSTDQLSPTSAQVEADMMRHAPAAPAARKENAAPRMGGPSNGIGTGGYDTQAGQENSLHGQGNGLKRPGRDRDKHLFAPPTGCSTPPTSFGQLLCSLPEASL